ncbi:hypothetical protein JHK82_050457 [Glycine max]|nr:hypothetical protein JHK82_050457 [Glycine max]
MAGKDRILILGPTGRLLIEVQLKINVAIKKAGNVKVRYIRVSNETSYGVMEFVHAWKVEAVQLKYWVHDKNFHLKLCLQLPVQHCCLADLERIYTTKAILGFKRIPKESA